MSLTSLPALICTYLAELLPSTISGAARINTGINTHLLYFHRRCIVVRHKAFIKGTTFLIPSPLDIQPSLVKNKSFSVSPSIDYQQSIGEMSTDTELTKEQYEKQLTAPLLSEEALTLLNPYSIRIEQAYYEHGFDRLTFTINNLEYSIPACLLTLPTLYFVGFNRAAACEIYAEFQAAPINDNASFRFEKIARTYLWHKFSKIWFCEIKPKTTHEALDYVGLSDEAQTNILRLEYPLKGQRAEFMLRHVTIDNVDDWAMRYVNRRLRILTNLDYQIKTRAFTDERESEPVDLNFLADEIENKYMDSERPYGNILPNALPLTLITDLP